MSYRLIPLAALVLTSGAVAQRSSPSEAAKSFTLDGLAPSPSPTPEPSSSPGAAPSAVIVSDSPPPDPITATPPPALRTVFTLDTPIQDLIANPAAKAVMDRDLPGMSDDSNLDKFKGLSLRGFQPLTGGQLTDAMLAKVATDLAGIVGGEARVTLPRTGTSKRNKDDSR